MNKSLSAIRYEMKEITDLVAFLDNEENELDIDTVNDTRESVRILLESKSEQLELILKHQEIAVEKCKEISKFYAEKAKKTKEREEALKEIIKETMISMGEKRIETSTGTFTIRKNAPSVIVDDEDLIPKKFVTIVQTNKIEKAEIKKAIKNGEEVAGVHMESSQSLIMK